jgi:hypothetical protein
MYVFIRAHALVHLDVPEYALAHMRTEIYMTSGAIAQPGIRWLSAPRLKNSTYICIYVYMYMYVCMCMTNGTEDPMHTVHFKDLYTRMPSLVHMRMEIYMTSGATAQPGIESIIKKRR